MKSWLVQIWFTSCLSKVWDNQPDKTKLWMGIW